jgi:hypothetical protein
MATATSPLPPMPGPNVPLVNPRTGVMDPRWFQFFTALARLVSALRLEIP